MIFGEVLRRVLWRVNFLPNYSCNEVLCAKYLIHQVTKIKDFVVIKTNKNCSFRRQKLSCEF